MGKKSLTGWLKGAFISVLSVLSLLTLAFVLPVPVRSDIPSSPSLEVGDQWRYSLQTSFTSQGFSLQGTMTMSVSSEETVSLQSGSYESYKIQVSSSGTVSGSITGTWTNTGTIYARKSDLAGLKTNLNQVIVVGVTITQTIESTMDSPSRTYDFPLSVGKSWVETTTSTTNFTQVLSTGERTTSLNTTTTTTNYTVPRAETLTVAAGTFETLVIHRTDQTGSSGDDYYSSQVGNSVKISTFDSASGTQSNGELLEVKAWPHKATVDVLAGGKTYGVSVRANMPPTNLRQNSTAVAFDVSGSSGLTGSARVSIPKGLNTTRVRVYVDSSLVTSSASADSNNYYVSFTFTLSDHTIMVVFSEPAGFFSNPYVLGGIGAAVLAAVLASIILLAKRRKPPPMAATPPSPAEPVGPSTPPTESPAPQEPAKAGS